MRCKAHSFFLHSDANQNAKETYGLKSRKVPPTISQLASFEQRIMNLISILQFHQARSKFQQDLIDDVKHIKTSVKLVIPAVELERAPKNPS